MLYAITSEECEDFLSAHVNVVFLLKLVLPAFCYCGQRNRQSSLLKVIRGYYEVSASPRGKFVPVKSPVPPLPTSSLGSDRPPHDVCCSRCHANEPMSSSASEGEGHLAQVCAINGQRRESPRTSGGWLEDGRSDELKRRTGSEGPETHVERRTHCESHVPSFQRTPQLFTAAYTEHQMWTNPQLKIVLSSSVM